MIFDDIFSALDAKTASWIMNNTILGVLKKNTILLITHAVHFSKFSDKIFVMENGKIVKEGTYDKLKNTELLIKFSEIEEVIFLFKFFFLVEK